MMKRFSYILLILIFCVNVFTPKAYSNFVFENQKSFQERKWTVKKKRRKFFIDQYEAAKTRSYCFEFLKNPPPKNSKDYVYKSSIKDCNSISLNKEIFISVLLISSFIISEEKCNAGPPILVNSFRGPPVI